MSLYTTVTINPINMPAIASARLARFPKSAETSLVNEEDDRHAEQGNHHEGGVDYSGSADGLKAAGHGVCQVYNSSDQNAPDAGQLKHGFERFAS